MHPDLPLILAGSFVKHILLAIHSENTVLECALPIEIISTTGEFRNEGYLRPSDSPLVPDTLYLVVHAKHDVA